eukprot:4150883-Pyramimonas_sp.AAC.1
MIAQAQWLDSETRPDVFGSAPLLSAALPSPTVEGALLGIKVVQHLKFSASQRITIWPLDASSVTFVAISDAGGPWSAKRGGAQGAWL